MRSPRILGATGAILALTMIQAIGMGGCDLSYLTEGAGASTTGTTTSFTGGAGGTTSSTGGAGGTTSSTGGAGGTTTSSAGGTTSTGGTGGAPALTALVFSRGFGDPTSDDDVAPANNAAPPGGIVVAPMAGGAMFVAFHAAGSNVLVAGEPYSKDPTTDKDIFLAVIDAEGTLVASRHLSMPGEQTVLSVAAAGPGGPFYLGGLAVGPLVLPDDLGGVATTNGGNDGYVLKIEADLSVSGAMLWMGTGYQRAQSLFVDATGALWMGGQSGKAIQGYAPTPGTGQTSIGSCGAADYVPKAGKSGGFVARMSADLSSCTRVFAFGLDAAPNGTTVDVDIHGIAVDADQNLYVAGRFQGTLTVDTAPPITSPVEAGYAVKVAASDGAHWSTAFRGSSYPNTLWSLALAADRVIVTGQGGLDPIFSRAVPGAAQKNGETCLLNAVGALDGTIVGLAKDSGACIEAGRLGGVAGSTERAFDAAVLPSGEVWVTGVFDTKLLVNGSLPNMSMDQGANIESFALRLAQNGLAATPPDIPFAQAWAGLRDQSARHLTVLSDGRVAVVGSYTGVFPAGAPDVQEGSPPDYFLLVLDPTLPIQPF